MFAGLCCWKKENQTRESAWGYHGIPQQLNMILGSGQKLWAHPQKHGNLDGENMIHLQMERGSLCLDPN